MTTRLMTIRLMTSLLGVALCGVGCEPSDGDSMDAAVGADQGAARADMGAPGPDMGAAEEGWRLLDDGPAHTEPALGLTVTLVEGPKELITRNPDGSIDYDFLSLVTLDARGEREVLAFETLDSIANGGRQTILTVDLETEEERWFHFEPEDNAIVVGDEDGGVFIFQSPDGTYDVVTSRFDEPVDDAAFEFAEDGYAAWQLVQDYNQFTETSDYSLLLAYALAQRPALEARVFSHCEEPDCSSKKQARPPAVCQTFKAFCDCVACRAAGVGEGCELCQPE